MYEFRPLLGNETRILFTRHGEHRNQVVTNDDRDVLLRMGQALSKAGLKIDRMISSPEPRAVRTGLHILDGADQTPRVFTKHYLGDISTTHEVDKVRLKADAKAVGMEAEEYMLTSPHLSEIMRGRGAEGMTELVTMAADCKGDTLLVPSHGGSRMEVSILSLMKMNTLEARTELFKNGHPFKPFQRCAMIELILEGYRLISYHVFTPEDFDMETTVIQHGTPPETTDSGDRVVSRENTGPCPKGCL